jgi:hypothetical protein
VEITHTNSEDKRQKHDHPDANDENPFVNYNSKKGFQCLFSYASFFSFFSVSKFALEPRYCPKTTSKREVNSLKEAPEAPKGRDLVNRFTRNTMVH